MYTPEQLKDISFGTARFGGYNMKDVDAVVEKLTEDYITLYNDNALLKSKMKVLVTKLEEYRIAEASMKEAVVNTQKACDTMIAETTAKCEDMLKTAGAGADEACAEANARIAAENARLEEARQVAARQIGELQSQLESCIKLLSEIKESNRPAMMPQTPPVSENTAAVAKQIAESLEALVGAEDDTPSSPSLPPLDSDSLSLKFSNLQFGKNYDPDNR